MKDETERILESLTPCGARPELRDDVLGAVAKELAKPRPLPRHRKRWDLRIAGTMAVSLVLGVLMNVWAFRSDDASHARLFGPTPLPRSICEAIETANEVAGPECAALIERRLVSAWEKRPPTDPRALLRYYQRLTQFVLTEKDFYDVQEDPEGTQMDGHPAGLPDRRAARGQRGFCLA